MLLENLLSKVAHIEEFTKAYANFAQIISILLELCKTKLVCILL